MDRIADIAAIQPQPGRLKSGDTRGRQIALATSAFDDQRLFTGSDNKDDDRTTQTAVGTQEVGTVGGRLRAQYVNKTRPNGKPLTAVVDVCPPAMRSRMTVRVFNFTGGPDVRTYLQQARSIWAQLCVAVDVIYAAVPAVDPTLLEPEDCTWQDRPDLGPQAKQRQLSQRMIDLIDRTRLPVPNAPDADWDHEIALYFVKHVTKSLNNRVIGGRARTDTGEFDGLPAGMSTPLDEEPRHRLGVAFVFTDTIEGTAASGIDVAHEIAHLVFGPFHTQKKTGNAYDIPVSILWGIRTPPDSPLQRRFTTGQVQQVRQNQGQGIRFIRK